MTTTVTEPPDLTIDQVAVELSIHPETVRGLIRAGQLPAYKPGQRRWRVRRQDLDAFKQGRENTLALPGSFAREEPAERLAELKARRIPQSLAELKPRVPPPPGLTAMQMIRGRWPGDETEEELLAALKAMG